MNKTILYAKESMLNISKAILIILCIVCSLSCSKLFESSSTPDSPKDIINNIVGNNIVVGPFTIDSIDNEFKIDQNKFAQKYGGKEIYAVTTHSQETEKLFEYGNFSLEESFQRHIIVIDSNRKDQRFLNANRTIRSPVYVTYESSKGFPDSLASLVAYANYGDNSRNGSYSIGYSDKLFDGDTSVFYFYNKRLGKIINGTLALNLAKYIRLILAGNKVIKPYTLFNSQDELNHLLDNRFSFSLAPDTKTILEDIKDGNYLYNSIKKTDEYEQDFKPIIFKYLIIKGTSSNDNILDTAENLLGQKFRFAKLRLIDAKIVSVQTKLSESTMSFLTKLFLS